MLNEKSLSLSLHQKYVPVLISSSLLRRYGCGQIDISYIYKKELSLVEIKSSSIGVLSAQKGQKLRLLRSASFLEATLNIPTCVKFIVKKIAKG